MTETRFAYGDDLPEAGRQVFRKTAPATMVRIEGPFTVETSEGPLHCEDGWVARDSRGYLYPIAADEQAAIYEPIREAQ